MLHKNAIKYVKQEYTLIFIYYVIRFGIIRFGSVRIPKLRYSVFRYFTRFGPPLTHCEINCFKTWPLCTHMSKFLKQTYSFSLVVTHTNKLEMSRSVGVFFTSRIAEKWRRKYFSKLPLISNFFPLYCKIWNFVRLRDESTTLGLYF